MKIGILQSGHVPDPLVERLGGYTDLYAAMLDGHGFTFETWSVVDGVFPDGPDAADGWLVTGSRHGAYEDLPWIDPLSDLIRAIMAGSRPLVGVCFGHQIIAQAQGARVEKFAGGWSIGPKRYSFPGGPLVVHAWHQDQVMDLPRGAEIVASNAFTALAALHYPGRALTVQPHPEFSDAFVEGLMEFRSQAVPPEVLKAARQAMGAGLDSARVGGMLARFLKERRL